jgi:hypothetical protein
MSCNNNGNKLGDSAFEASVPYCMFLCHLSFYSRPVVPEARSGLLRQKLKSLSKKQNPWL